MQQQSRCVEHGHDCHQGIFSRNLFVGQRIPARRVWPTRTGPSGSAPTRRTSALDPNCRAHEVDNLYVVDGSFFPSSGAVNPALTIMANALRVGDRILERLGEPAEREAAHGGGRGGGMSLAGTRRGSLRLAPGDAGRARAGRAPRRAAPRPGGGPVAGPRRVGGGPGGCRDRSIRERSRRRRSPWSASPSPTCSGRWTSTPGSWTSPRTPTTSSPGRRSRTLQGVFGARIRVVRLRLGEERLQLTEYLAPRGRPAPVDARSNDHWFQHVAIIVSDMDSAYARLRRFGVQHASTGPQTLPKTIPGAAGIRAFYFRDPDGHPARDPPVPARQGRRQMAPRLRPALPRDRPHGDRGGRHRDEPGLLPRRPGISGGGREPELRHRAGAPQQRARRAASDHRPPRGWGPGVEFLEYLAPADGRPFPADEQANDLVHWQTTILVPDAAAAAKVVRRGRFRLVSPGAVTLPDTSLGFRRGLRVRDPDGHVVQLVEQ